MQLMSIFKKTLQVIFNLVMLAGAIWLFFWIRENKQVVLEKAGKVIDIVDPALVVSKKELPLQSGMKEIVYSWQYAGKYYELKEALYTSTFNFYQASPKAYRYKGELPANWENDYYAMFFMSANGDEFILKMANDLQELGRKNKLSDDQIVELVLAFVQRITYDDAKANAILSGGQESIYYPYETLFVQSGVCSDKSILAAKLLQSLGYGTAIFTYEAEKHMALGIKCPMEYSNNNSGYCYAETTSVGFRIGMIPDFDVNNKAVAEKQLKFFDQGQVDQFNIKRLGPPKIFQTTDGKSYNGIAKTMAVAREIDGLKISIQNLGKSINSFRNQIESSQANLENLMVKMKKLKKSEDYDEYNSLVKKYNNLADDYGSNVEKYNAMIGDYNQKVARYNFLLKSF